MTKILKEMEIELTHSHNMLEVASDEIEDLIDTGDMKKLRHVLSVIVKANDNILEQLDNIVELNVRKTA